MHGSQEQFRQAWMYDRKEMPGFICADFFFFCFFLLSQIYGLFPSVYNSRYPRQVSEDDHSCGFPNSDEPDVFTAFRVKMVNLMSWDNSWIEGTVALWLYQYPRNAVTDSTGNRPSLGPCNSLVIWISDLKLLTKNNFLCGYCTLVVWFRMPRMIGCFNWISHSMLNLHSMSNCTLQAEKA